LVRFFPVNRSGYGVFVVAHRHTNSLLDSLWRHEDFSHTMSLALLAEKITAVIP
jgi:hypothetical protein